MSISGKVSIAATVAVASLLQPAIALAGILDAQIRLPVSEPETLALIAIGAVAVIIARIRRRK